jgi:signal transduction histidine kinase
MAHGSLNILIADDDEGDRKQVKRALRHTELRCDFVEAISIEEALDACDKLAFDCAIVDYRMPGRDGLHGIAAMRERHPYLCIIMATGQGDEIVAAEAMKRGASDYIAKRQINSESLGRVIESAMEKAALRRKVAEQREELENFALLLVHDLKAPMRSIQGFVGLIERKVKQGKTEDLAEYCRFTVDAAQRMDALIDTLHQYTKADERVRFGPVEMLQVMKDTLSNLGDSIGARGARITYGDLPAVIGNAPQITQLMQNLIANALKYCEEPKTPSIHVAAEPQEIDFWLFTVKDNGVGIPEEFYERAFDAFRRLPGAGKQEGTGLGLATCRKIVKRHGGSIRCSSEQGQGTSFFFTLPGARGHS